MNFWQGKRVLVTGHTGFKGSWLSLWLQHLGAEVVGLALEPPTSPNLFTGAQVASGMTSILGDIRDFQCVLGVVDVYKPEIILHLAAQPLVRHSYTAPLETYHTNVLGTAHVLEAARLVPGVRAIVNVTTDKCYENQEWCWGYREVDSLGGHDPYSNSKACSELVTQSYRDSFFAKSPTRLASARAGNVIGGGDWAEDRLVPDIIRACISQTPVTVRNPHAIRPWQHVLEPLSGYLRLAEKLFSESPQYDGAWNFGPLDEDARSVGWIVDFVTRNWHQSIGWQLDHADLVHEAHRLKLDCSKAQAKLGWKPRWTLEKALLETIKWYEACAANACLHTVTLQQIKEFMQVAQYETRNECVEI